MAKVSEQGIPGVGTGILQPKITNRFRVVFNKAALLPVSMQIIKIYPPEVDFGLASAGLISNKQIYFEYQDDVLSGASKALHKFGEKGLPFNLTIEILNGNDVVLEKMCFTSCTVNQITHVNPLDYSCGGDSTMHVRVNPKGLVGNLPESVPGGPELLELLYKFFYNMKIDVDNAYDKPSAAVTRGVTLSFESRKDSFQRLK